MNIVVTGATGLLGRYLISQLKAEEAEYIALSRKPNIGSKIIQTDYSKESLEKVMRNGEILIHLAGSRVNHEYITTYQNEIDMLYNLLETAKKYNYEKVIIASSISVYGYQNRLPWSENRLVEPNSNYALNKVLIEQISSLYNRQTDLEISILRFSHIFGINEKNNYMINLFMRKAFNRESLNVSGTANVKREFLYAKDAALAIMKVISSSGISGVYNIKGSEVLSNMEVAVKINKVFDNHLLIHTNKLLPDKFHPSYMDGSQAEKNFNYKPTYSFEEAMYEIYEQMKGLDYVQTKY